MTTSLSNETLLRHLGRPSRDEWPTSVNFQPFRASTITFADMESYADPSARAQGLRYGRLGTPASIALEKMVAELEGGFGAVCYPSGLAAIGGALLSHLVAGDHVLLPDSIYHMARVFCERQLPLRGIQFDYYPPEIGAGIASLIRPQTRVVYVESPGSATFEIQDIPAMAQAAHAAGAIVVMDNTWATPLLFPAFQHGVDISVHAATKYLAGHSDAMIGISVCNERTYAAVRQTADDFGVAVGSEEVYLTLRGLRTLDLRLQRHGVNALALAGFLAQRPEVEAVLCPALPGAAGHELWQRDFKGVSGLFSVVLKPEFADRAHAFIDSLRLFSIGASWGGYESMVKPFLPMETRHFDTWSGRAVLRFHAGLENAEDLIADLGQAFEAAQAAP